MAGGVTASPGFFVADSLHEVAPVLNSDARIRRDGGRLAMSGVSRTGVNAISTLEKQRRALELRKAGATFEQIADSLGYQYPSAAAKAVKTAMKAIIKEPAEEVRDMEVARCDAMLFAIWSQVKAGNHGAIDRALRIQERRASYLGLDAPKAYDLGGDLTQTIRIIGVPAEDI